MTDIIEFPHHRRARMPEQAPIGAEHIAVMMLRDALFAVLEAKTLEDAKRRAAEGLAEADE